MGPAIEVHASHYLFDLRQELFAGGIRGVRSNVGGDFCLRRLVTAVPRSAACPSDLRGLFPLAGAVGPSVSDESRLDNMSRSLQNHSRTLRSKPPLLLTESQSDFDDLVASFRREIVPRGVIEQIYFDDIITSVWEILRLRRCKTVIVNIAFKKALRALLEPQLDYDRAQILPNDGSMTEPQEPKSLEFSAN